MNSKSKIPSIPIEGSISWEDWLKGRRARRESSQLVAPGINRRQRPAAEKAFQGRTRPAFHKFGIPVTILTTLAGMGILLLLN